MIEPSIQLKPMTMLKLIGECWALFSRETQPWEPKLWMSNSPEPLQKRKEVGKQGRTPFNICFSFLQKTYKETSTSCPKNSIGWIPKNTST
jgi:hypothetical protein